MLSHQAMSIIEHTLDRLMKFPTSFNEYSSDDMAPLFYEEWKRRNGDKADGGVIYRIAQNASPTAHILLSAFELGIPWDTDKLNGDAVMELLEAPEYYDEMIFYPDRDTFIDTLRTAYRVGYWESL